jgi:hypothetical protein
MEVSSNLFCFEVLSQSAYNPVLGGRSLLEGIQLNKLIIDNVVTYVNQTAKITGEKQKWIWKEEVV